MIRACQRFNVDIFLGMIIDIHQNILHRFFLHFRDLIRIKRNSLFQPETQQLYDQPGELGINTGIISVAFFLNLF